MGKKKWKRVDPATIKVGDRVRFKVTHSGECGYTVTTEGVVSGTCKHGAFRFADRDSGVICNPRGASHAAPPGVSLAWYVRKPKHPKLKATVWAEPLTRPDEPPVGSLFRVERSGVNYCRGTVAAYVPVHGELRWRWDQITKPGDTITLLDLVERDA